MKTFTSTAKTRPEVTIVGKHYVDVNTNIEEVDVPLSGVRHKRVYEPDELETVFKFQTTRYTLQEYVSKTAADTALLKEAVAELADAVTGGN